MGSVKSKFRATNAPDSFWTAMRCRMSLVLLKEKPQRSPFAG